MTVPPRAKGSVQMVESLPLLSAVVQLPAQFWHVVVVVAPEAVVVLPVRQ